jgi:hypothetical protein
MDSEFVSLTLQALARLHTSPIIPPSTRSPLLVCVCVCVFVCVCIYIIYIYIYQYILPFHETDESAKAGAWKWKPKASLLNKQLRFGSDNICVNFLTDTTNIQIVTVYTCAVQL